MAKKDFTQVNTEPVYDAISNATTAQKPRKTYTPEEAEELKASRKTQGRKGTKLPRVNLALSPQIYDYVKTVSTVCGMTITDFINGELQRSFERNRDVYDEAIAFRNKIQNS